MCKISDKSGIFYWIIAVYLGVNFFYQAPFFLDTVYMGQCMVCLNVTRDEKLIVGGNEFETFIKQKK